MSTTDLSEGSAETSLPELAAWVGEIADLTRPEAVLWCDGSQAKWDRLTDLLVENGSFTRLNPKLRPNSFWCRSDPRDVARVEDRTLICSERERDRGADQQLDRAGRDAPDLRGGLRRVHGRTDHVRGAVLHGPT